MAIVSRGNEKQGRGGLNLLFSYGNDNIISFQFNLDAEGHFFLTLHSPGGKKIWETGGTAVEAGRQDVFWNFTDAAKIHQGIFCVTLKHDFMQVSRKVTVLK